MADWNTIEATLETWVAGITGLPVHWRHRPSGFEFSGRGFALLSISARRSLGHDDLTYTDDGATPGEEVTYYQSGQRQFTLQVQVRTHRQAPGSGAKQYTPLLRDSLSLPQRTRSLLSAADLAIARVANEVDFDARIDGREASVAQLDIIVNASALTADTPTTYIETVSDADAEMPPGDVVWTGDIPV